MCRFSSSRYVLVTQTFSQADKQHHSSEPCYQYPEPPDTSPGGISRQLEAGEPPAPRLLDDFSRESKELARAAETQPKGASKLQHAEEFLRSLTTDTIVS